MADDQTRAQRILTGNTQAQQKSDSNNSDEKEKAAEQSSSEQQSRAESQDPGSDSSQTRAQRILTGGVDSSNDLEENTDSGSSEGSADAVQEKTRAQRILTGDRTEQQRQAAEELRDSATVEDASDSDIVDDQGRSAFETPAERASSVATNTESESQVEKQAAEASRNYIESLKSERRAQEARNELASQREQVEQRLRDLQGSPSAEELADEYRRQAEQIAAEDDFSQSDARRQARLSRKANRLENKSGLFETSSGETISRQEAIDRLENDLQEIESKMVDVSSQERTVRQQRDRLADTTTALVAEGARRENAAEENPTLDEVYEGTQLAGQDVPDALGKAGGYVRTAASSSGFELAGAAVDQFIPGGDDKRTSRVVADQVYETNRMRSSNNAINTGKNLIIDYAQGPVGTAATAYAGGAAFKGGGALIGRFSSQGQKIYQAAGALSGLAYGASKASEVSGELEENDQAEAVATGLELGTEFSGFARGMRAASNRYGYRTGRTEITESNNNVRPTTESGNVYAGRGRLEAETPVYKRDPIFGERRVGTAQSEGRYVVQMSDQGVTAGGRLEVVRPNTNPRSRAETVTESSDFFSTSRPQFTYETASGRSATVSRNMFETSSGREISFSKNIREGTSEGDVFFQTPSGQARYSDVQRVDYASYGGRGGTERIGESSTYIRRDSISGSRPGRTGSAGSRSSSSSGGQTEVSVERFDAGGGGRTSLSREEISSEVSSQLGSESSYPAALGSDTETADLESSSEETQSLDFTAEVDTTEVQERDEIQEARNDLDVDLERPQRQERDSRFRGVQEETVSEVTDQRNRPQAAQSFEQSPRTEERNPQVEAQQFGLEGFERSRLTAVERVREDPATDFDSRFETGVFQQGFDVGATGSPGRGSPEGRGASLSGDVRTRFTATVSPGSSGENLDLLSYNVAVAQGGSTEFVEGSGRGGPVNIRGALTRSELEDDLDIFDRGGDFL